ncbi:hypothetical protein EON62_04305 [archaeon]|nr:MAG: hypothetical protein EON62_04305 [archaeon]
MRRWTRQARYVAARRSVRARTRARHEWVCVARRVVARCNGHVCARPVQIHPSGQILVMKQFCPWKDHLFELEEERRVAAEAAGVAAPPKALYVLFEDSSKSWYDLSFTAHAPAAFCATLSYACACACTRRRSLRVRVRAWWRCRMAVQAHPGGAGGSAVLRLPQTAARAVGWPP